MSSRNGRSVLVLAVLASLLIGSGCYTTTYYNFQPKRSAEVIEHTGDEPRTPRHWRHFWVYGLAPGEMPIDAAEACGGSEHVEKLETEQTFVQGLIEAFAGYYINVYAPYTARVVCDHSSPG